MLGLVDGETAGSLALCRGVVLPRLRTEVNEMLPLPLVLVPLVLLVLVPLLLVLVLLVPSPVECLRFHTFWKKVERSRPSESGRFSDSRLR